MQKRLVYIIAITLVIALAGIDSSALAKSKGRKSAKTRVSKSSRGKAKSSRVARASGGKRGRVVVARSRRGRRARYRTEAIADSQITYRRTGIPAERVSEIQNALIKSGHMTAPASGEYDQSTVEAMKAFQARNGLRQTGLPSATTLKKLSVAKTSNDGYSVPIKRGLDNGKVPGKTQD
jgi:murein L,D-transpeptidase YcbB/YkuD